MNKRETKRFACGRAANIIATALDSGWIPVPSEGATEDEEIRIADALDEIIVELDRRSKGPSDGRAK